MSDLAPTHADRLAALKAEYAQFRAQAKPRQRVSDALRDATLDLIKAGFSERVVVAACGLQLAQLDRWRNRRSTSAPAPRVLEVVDAPVGGESTTVVTIKGRRVVIELLP